MICSRGKISNLQQSMKITYPTKCEIVDATGIELEIGTARNPEQAIPHIGKTGIAEKINGQVSIKLEDGTKLMGYECWWAPI